MSRAVVVTGAAGFIAGHVVTTLLDAGHEVVAIDRRPRPPHLLNDGLLTYLTLDLSEPNDEMNAALGSADAVLHLAGCPGVRDRAPDIERRRLHDNVHATGAVLAATPLATPMVVVSSSSVYGGSHWARPCREEDRLSPRGGYALSKVRAERLCAMRRDAGGSVTVVRPFTVAGERQRPDMALSRWLDAARAGLPLTVLGSLSRTRDVTDVRDVAGALVALARRDASTTVNVGTGRARTLDELTAAVLAVTGRDVLRVIVDASDDDVRHTLAWTSRLRHLTGLTPSTDLEAVVARQAAAARAVAALS
jgi:nucleoside-diphosphate-sugar epimerase